MSLISLLGTRSRPCEFFETSLCFEVLLYFMHLHFCFPPPTVWQLGKLVGGICCRSVVDMEETCVPSRDLRVWEADAWAHCAVHWIKLCVIYCRTPPPSWEAKLRRWHISLMVDVSGIVLSGEGPVVYRTGALVLWCGARTPALSARFQHGRKVHVMIILVNFVWQLWSRVL